MSTLDIGVCTGPVWIKVTFTGLNGSGNISIPGLEVGDVVVRIWMPANGYQFAENSFQQYCYVADNFHQNDNNDLTVNTYEALFMRW
jgi:hypothetical protein